MLIPLLPDFRFAQPGWLWLLLPAILFVVLSGGRRRLPSIVFGALRHFGDTGHNTRGARGGAGSLWYVAALCSGLVALAQPQKIHQHESTSGDGVEIAVAIDVSFSMCIEDFQLGRQRVNRLTAAKSVLEDFVKGRPDDRIGLVIFAGRPHTLGPLTVDHDWLLATIKREIHFKHPIASGTAIGTAIAESAKRISRRDAASKVVVLITDGDQTVEGLSPEDAAKLAATLGIKVYPIAIGTPGEHFAPLMQRKLTTSFDFSKLERVATITGAKAFRATDTDSLRTIFEQIDSLEKSKIERHSVIETTEYYQWPAAAAALLALLAMLGELTLARVSPA